jgi:hypothetical protein
VSPAYVGSTLVKGYVGNGDATATQVDLVALAGGGTAPVTPPAPSTGKIYVGAWVTGSYELNNRGAASGMDGPYGAAASAAKPTPLDTFEGSNGVVTTRGSMGGARLAYLQFGLGKGWNPQPNLANYTTLVNDSASRGAFNQFDWAATTQAISDILADNATARSNWTSIADTMLNNGRPVLFRPLWEFNGNWYEWGISATGPAGQDWSALGTTAAQRDSNYITMWRRIWQYVADRAAGVAAGTGTGTATRNVSFFWCPNYWLSASLAQPGFNRYPGDKYVDWVGIDAYARANTGATPDSLFGFAMNELETKTTKPIAIGEWGVMDSVGGAGKAAFFNTFFGTYLQKHPRIKAANYFHNSGADGNDNWIPTIEANRVAYATGVASVGLGNTSTLTVNQKLAVPA